jgi:hypothetical protein
MPEWVKRFVSEPRMKPYLRAAGGDAGAAMRLYRWNTEVSDALYIPLHYVELAVRNALHGSLVDRYGRRDWWAVAPLDAGGSELVASARAKCRRNEKRRAREQQRRERPVSVDDVVTELNFGFWTTLLVKRYDRTFWRVGLYRAFPYYSGPRALLSDDLHALVRLRNRVMHYEPIHEEDLEGHHARIYRVLEALSPDLAKEVRAMDRLRSVLDGKEDALE